MFATINTAQIFHLVNEAAAADDAVLDGLGGDVLAVGEHDRVLVPPRDDQITCGAMRYGKGLLAQRASGPDRVKRELHDFPRQVPDRACRKIAPQPREPAWHGTVIL